MKWIDINDRLPEKEENKSYSQVPCIVRYQGETTIFVFNHTHHCWDRGDGDDYYCDIKDVTHWMPLPEPPK